MTHANLQKIAKCDIIIVQHIDAAYISKQCHLFLKFQIVHVSCRHKYVCERQFFVFMYAVLLYTVC